ncbi:hypothetical protein [Egicoccus sp. AB-alg2]|uniref:hypothetical protein n=1 Tax=Egicoccus sp. AB-alg2 TaxID=3242693 RepID=UPI00359DF447
MKKPLILIVSSSAEEHSYGRVVSHLEKHGARVLLWLTDIAIGSSRSFSILITEQGTVSIQAGSVLVDVRDIDAAWYWKPNSFRVPGAEENVSRQMTYVNEVTSLNRALWSVLPESIWLSSPLQLWRAERKFQQLLLAREVGFEIPRTMVSSDWSMIEKFMGAETQNLVVKMARGVLADQNHVMAMPTTLLALPQRNALQGVVSPFPGIYQPYLEKRREWRITTVKEEAFPAAIYTNGKSRVDWRQSQTSNDVTFAKEDPPSLVLEYCVEYLRRSELGYGAFDLVEDEDGQFFFLECNPSGQYSWLEELLGLPISGSLAASLLPAQ